MASEKQKPILISGAGLASLLLARVLLNHNIPFRIFERDASLAFRGQGYRLRLSNEGLDAIEASLDPKGWERFWETCGKTGGAGLVTFDARNGVILEDSDGPPSGKGTNGADAETKQDGGRPGDAVTKLEKKQEEGKKSHDTPLKQLGRGPKEALTSRGGQTVGIARGEMREVFLEGAEEYVQWSKDVTGYEMSPSGDGVFAIFRDGSRSEEGSMLIGGEGIHSKIAKQLSGGKLKVFDTASRGIHGQAPTSAFRGLGEGVFRIVDDENPTGKLSIITNVRSGDKDRDDIQFGWTMIGQPGVIHAPNDDYTIVGKVAADIAKKLTKDWDAKFKPLFDNMDEKEAAFWKM
jgi:hypothetical protein